MGLPKWGFWSCERLDQSAQAPSGAVRAAGRCISGAGGVVLVPRVLAAVMEPRVMITMSVGLTGMVTVSMVGGVAGVVVVVVVVVLMLFEVVEVWIPEIVVASVGA